MQEKQVWGAGRRPESLDPRGLTPLPREGEPEQVPTLLGYFVVFVASARLPSLLRFNQPRCLGLSGESFAKGERPLSLFRFSLSEAILGAETEAQAMLARKSHAREGRRPGPRRYGGRAEGRGVCRHAACCCCCSSSIELGDYSTVRHTPLPPPCRSLLTGCNAAP